MAYSLSGFANVTDNYQTGAGEGVRGAGAGFWIAVAFRHRSSASAFAVLSAAGTISADGWAMYFNSSNVLIFRSHNNVGGNVNAPTTAVTADGMIHLALGFQTASLVELWLDRVRIGAGTSITGYTGPAAGDQHTVGCNDTDGQAYTFGEILGVAGGDTDFPASAAEAESIFDEVKASVDMVAPSLVTAEYVWSVKRGAQAVPAEWIEEEGTGENLDKSGTAIVRNCFVPQWAW